jgi:hypothetical protein
MKNGEITMTEENMSVRSVSTLVTLEGHGRKWENCLIRVNELIQPIWLRRAAAYSTQNPDVLSKTPLKKWYLSEHSPIRMSEYFVEMRGIPNYVCGHLVRHHVGCVPYMQTSRPDRGGADDSSRYDPKNLAIKMNAQGLIDVAQVRLCVKADSVTLEVFKTIKKLVGALDCDLEKNMLPRCEYRGGNCCEMRPCGRYRAWGD